MTETGERESVIDEPRTCTPYLSAKPTRVSSGPTVCSRKRSLRSFGDCGDSGDIVESVKGVVVVSCGKGEHS